MLRIIQRENQVRVTFDTDLTHEKGGTTIYNFTYTVNEVQYAELLTRYLNTQLGNSVKGIREQAYNAGYRDAKAKVKRETYFSGLI